MESSNTTTNEEYLRMDLTKSDLFLEILTFLEGVNQFLGNDFFDTSSLSDEDKTKLGEQRRSLHTKSNYLWKLFNLSINDDVNVNNYPYLNMNTSKKHVKLDENEQTYDYCSFETNFDENESKSECPYLKFSTTEVKSKGNLIDGELVQIERRSFFGKPKTMYVILIEKWLLVYGSKTEKRPIQCIHVKKYEKIPDNIKTNAFKIFSFHDEKPSEFQCNSEKQFNEWITALEALLKSKRTSHGYVNVEKGVNVRKLPTPPAINFRKSNKSDDIYEEPDLINVRKSNLIPENEKNENNTDKIEEELTYDNVDHHVDKPLDQVIPDMPHIPVKLGSFKALPVIVCPNYDVPKNNRLVLSENSSENESKDTKNESSIEITKSKSQKKLSQSRDNTPSASHSRSSSKHETCASSVVQNTEEIKEKLRQQGITLTPIQSHPVSSSKSSSKFSLSSPTKDLNKQTIKNWFKTKMNKSPSDKEKRKSASDVNAVVKPSSNECNRSKKSLSNDGSTPNKPIINSKVINNNGSKVNMIIHQLEANGHLQHLLTKTKVQRRHTIVDDSYELVCNNRASAKEVF